MEKLSRRAMLGRSGSAAVATLALGNLSLASGPSDDPMFAAISAHWTAYGAFADACAAADVPSDDPRADELNARRDKAGDADWEAAWAMLDVEVSTVGGVVALLRYVNAFRSGGYREWLDRAEDEDGNGTVRFEDDVLSFAANALVRLTGGEPINTAYAEVMAATPRPPKSEEEGVTGSGTGKR